MFPRDPAATLSTGLQQPDTAFAVSPHHLASKAGIHMLALGGNAIDAAIAVDAVLGVVLPDTCGPGGDLFALIHEPGQTTPTTLNASGRAGSGATADDIRDAGHGEIPLHSEWSVSVPGCVDGWIALSDRFGQLPLSACLAPAIEIAEAGFPASAELSWSLERLADSLLGQPSAAALYPGGAAPASGTTLTRPDIARTLSGIAEDGRDAFYGGDVAHAICTATNGVLTVDDLARDQAEWIAPVGLDLFGRTAWTIPPNSQGYLTLATLGVFEALDPPTDPADPLFHHLLIEAYRSVAWEREMYVSDPETAPLSPDELVARDRLAEIAATIDRDRAGRWPTPHPSVGGTAYMNTRDHDGMAVSFIQSNYHGIGSRRSAGTTGVFLHNRAAGFNLIPGHANEYTPGRRPMHTLAPTLWTDGSELALVLGTRGGDQQPQFLSQVAALYFHAGLDPSAAQAHPRWSMDQPHPGTDSALTMESLADGGLVRTLRGRGHTVGLGREMDPGYGPVSMITGGSTPEAAADPRVSTSAAVAQSR